MPNALFMRALRAFFASTILLGAPALAVDLDNDGIDAAVDPNDRVPRYHVSAGDRHTCTLSDEGVFCWGFNFYKRTETPALVSPVQVSAGMDHTCALDTNGVTCWGLNNKGQSTPPALVSPSMVSAGGSFSCALDDNGVTCWGANDFLQLDVPPLTNPTTITTGQRHACALDDTGVVCWGDNTNNQRTVPSLPGAPLDISASQHSTCALTTSGVACWGDIAAAEAVPPLQNPRQVATGDLHACALDDTGLVCWGDNSGGQTDVPTLSNPYQVSSGGAHTCALDDSGLTCWGDNTDGAAVAPRLVDPQVVSLTVDSACAVDSGKVYCWGRDTSYTPFANVSNVTELEIEPGSACAVHDGQLSCWTSPALQQLESVPPMTNPLGVSSSSAQVACAVNDGPLECWGSDSSYPVIADMPAINAVKVSVGTNHACAIDGASTLHCWGDNGAGQSSPTVTSNVSEVAAGLTHTCAISSGTVSCWGDSTNMKLVVPTLKNPSKLFANEYYTCALHDDGLRCWGRIGHISGYTNVALTNPESVSTAWNSTCVIDDDGLECWGQNSYSTNNIPYLRHYNDHDGDGVEDHADGAPYDPTSTTVFVDSDADGTADSEDSFPNQASATTDEDGDGLPDDCVNEQLCLDDGLTPDPSLDDFDNDGLTSSEDADDTADTAAPTVIAAADIDIVATGPLTSVDLLQNGLPYASDFPDSVLTALPDTNEQATTVALASGRHLIDWCASDAAGNASCDTQSVDITPLLTFNSATQVTAEGTRVDVYVMLSGNPVSYPVTVPLMLGAASSATTPDDHNASISMLLIEADDPTDGLDANTAVYSFDTIDDGVTGEPDETVVLELVEDNGLDTLTGAALGDAALLSHTVTITEQNVAPVVILTADNTISLSSTTADYSINIIDPNAHSDYLVSWYFDGSLLQSANNLTTITHDLENVEAGTYTLQVTVLDNGEPAMQGGAEQEIIFTAPPRSSERSGDNSGGAASALIVLWAMLWFRRRRRRTLFLTCHTQQGK